MLTPGKGKLKGLEQAVVSQHSPAQVPWQVNLALGTDILAKAREEQAIWSKKQTTGETTWAAVWEQVGFSSPPQKLASSLGQAGYRLWLALDGFTYQFTGLLTCSFMHQLMSSASA